MTCQYPDCQNMFIATFEVPVKITFPDLFSVDQTASVYLCRAHAPEYMR